MGTIQLWMVPQNRHLGNAGQSFPEMVTVVRDQQGNCIISGLLWTQKSSLGLHQPELVASYPGKLQPLPGSWLNKGVATDRVQCHRVSQSIAPQGVAIPSLVAPQGKA